MQGSRACRPGPQAGSAAALSARAAGLARPARLCHRGAVLRRVLEACVFSSLWLAAAAAVLAAASARALGAAPQPRVLGLAACGTLVVYNVDRLRDVARDRLTAPRRTEFVERHRATLVALCVAASLAAGALALPLGPAPVWVLAPVLVAGLLHRRLKHAALLKPFYVALAWLAVVVGLPWCVAPAPTGTGWVLASLGGAIVANAIASNVRDGDGAGLPMASTHALAWARGMALAGLVAALAAPPPARSLAVVPALTLAALLSFRPSESYRLVCLDGALLAAGLLALAL